MLRNLFFVALLAGCAGASPEGETEQELGGIPCGASGHVIADAAAGDAFMACAAVQSVVTSNGLVNVAWSGGCVTVTVVQRANTQPLVVQLRDAAGAGMCPTLERL